VGTPNLISHRQPRLARDQNAGIAIPRWEGQGQLRFPVGRSMTLGFHVDYGFDEGSVALSDDQPDPQGDTFGTAASMMYTIPFSPEFDLGIAGQLWIYSIPYVEYDTCVNCPGGPFTDVQHDRNLIPVINVGILPTYKVGDAFSLFAGFSMRNHPTIQKSEVQLGSSISDEEVEAGPFNAIGSVGADMLLTQRVKLTAFIHRPISAVPVIYGVTAGVMLSITAGKISPAAPTPQ
jgi:hypothetical protein